MAPTRVYKRFIEEFVNGHVNEELSDGESYELIDSFLQMEGPPLLKVHSLKDKGNNLYKHNSFSEAALCYNKGCQVLCFVVQIMGDFDMISVSELAISLNLNLAACALKLKEHKAAKNLCSVVLSSFPNNVKALFRRASAFSGLKMFPEAHLDLQKGLQIEPKNKDFVRELSVVKEYLSINPNGKRCVDASMFDVVREGKRPSPDDGPQGDTHVSETVPLVSKPSSSSTCGSSNSVEQFGTYQVSPVPLPLCKMTKEPLKLDDCCSTPSDEMEVKSNLGNNQACDDQKIFHFNKKGGGHSQLRISEGNYKKLLQGDILSFSQKSQSITMRVRLIDSTTSSSSTNLLSPNFKKRRKRRRRKKRFVEKNDPSENIKSEEMVDCKPHGCNLLVGVSDSILSEELSQPSHSSNQVSVESQNQLLTIFSFSGSKRWKPFRVKRKICTNHCQGGESPRHSFSTLSSSRAFSKKFLRPCGVSVSCCRYSSEAHLKKKRKERSSQVSYWKRFRKKRCISITPIPILFSCSNDVINTSDFQSQMNTVC